MVSVFDLSHTGTEVGKLRVSPIPEKGDSRREHNDIRVVRMCSSLDSLGCLIAI